MPTRRQFLKLISISSIACFSAWASVGSAQTGNGSSANYVLTVDVLQRSLYAKTSEEMEYCEFVIRMRDEKILPTPTLYYAYKKAVQQDKIRRFAYFQKYLETACESQGIVLKDSATTQAKKFFGFKSNPTKATQTSTSASVLSKPTTQSSAGKKFSFFHRLFLR